MGIRRFAFAALVASQLVGCYTLTLSLDDPAGAEGQMVRSFHTEVKVHHVVLGLVTLGEPEVKKAIAEEVRRGGGKYAKNVRIVHQHSFLDGVIGFLTGSLYRPTTVIIEGDVVK